MAIISTRCLECSRKPDTDEPTIDHDPDDSGYIEIICAGCTDQHLNRCRACRDYQLFLTQQTQDYKS